MAITTTEDRRSGIERRAINRYPVEVDVEWEGADRRSTGSISDVSLDGCFVLSSGDVSDGDQVKIYIPLADGMKVEFTGRIANHVVEIGFGLKFDKLSDAQRNVLTAIVRASDDA